MNIKKLLTIACISLSIAVSMAQQDPQFSQNMFNKLATNAGYAGTSKAICGVALFRQQWVGFPGAPKTGVISFDANIDKIYGGVGLTVVTDQLGFEKNLFAKAAYSYHLPLAGGILGIGVEGGMLQKSITGNQWIALDDATMDASIPLNGTSSTTYDLGFGLFYSAQKFYLGLSSTHLPEQKLKDGDYSDYKYIIRRHYYATVGYDYALTPTFDLKPSVFVKYDGATTQMDFTLLAQYNKLFWAGASYRLTDAIVALAGINYGLANGSNIKIGYSYDFTMSAIKTHSSGTHEIMIGYCFKPTPKVKKQSHQNVRFL